MWKWVRETKVVKCKDNNRKERIVVIFRELEKMSWFGGYWGVLK